MFAEAFANLAASMPGSPFVDATAVWPGTPTKDAGGSIVTPGSPESHAVKAQFDTPTQGMRLAEGFEETDSRILVLTFDRDLDSSAVLTVGSERWALLSVMRDPAGVGYECRARKVA